MAPFTEIVNVVVAASATIVLPMSVMSWSVSTPASIAACRIAWTPSSDTGCVCTEGKAGGG